ncbi:restriction endonuclease [Pseudomonas aeruginosa]|uniref:restriction endonuclease n=1 Tax=Pseudomonas aeruginosa TaxID=287 RepID=UPI002351C669|nr:restriction endonuclease [Pseudomonas aeruginosa]MED5112472.1 restriction endonuclease [Pseudomonas aeruginosa]MED5124634.1 restriction endonuclease [Pseudomonas aeruginosa]
MEKVYVRAKRWQSTVGCPGPHDFYGTPAGQKIKRSVFITTFGFTTQAVDYARSAKGRC